MYIGISTITIHIPASQSLKNKRKVVKMLCDKISHRYNVSIAEIDAHDLWQKAVLGMAYVSNQAAQVDKTIATIINYITSLSGDFHLLDHQLEIITA